MNRSVILSICMALIATVWVLSGSLSSSEDIQEKTNRPLNEKNQEVSSAFKVKVQTRFAETMQDQIVLQGAMEAARTIEIRAETQGIVDKIYAKKGAQLQAGQSILSLAMNDREARLKKAKAELRVRQAELASSKSLKDKKMISENQHQQNVANVVAAEAEVQEIEVDIKQTNINAAFKGVLNDVHVELGDFVSPGTEIATLVDQDWVTITAQVPQQHIAKIRIGQDVEASLLNGVTLKGTINYISSSADVATRTFLIEAKAENSVGVQYFGQSARVRIYLGERSAYLISPSLLNLSNDGSLQVKIVDQDKRVVSKDVTIIRSDNNGVWLAGLPNQIELITVGQGFVSDNEVVEPVYAEKHPSSSMESTTSNSRAK